MDFYNKKAAKLPDDKILKFYGYFLLFPQCFLHLI